MQYEIKTKRLLLRPFTMDDVDDVLEYVNDPGIFEYQVGSQPSNLTREDVERIVSMCSNPVYWERGYPGLPPMSNGAGLLHIFAMVIEGTVIGEIGLNRRDEDKPNDRIEIVYGLSRKYWNRGLATEAAREVISWAFRNYDRTNRIYARCDLKNVGSWKVMEKIGMKREGLLRSHRKENGEFRDQLFYGILRSEWEVKKK